MTKINGSGSAQLPSNTDLGRMAFQDPNAVTLEPQASVTPNEPGQMVFQLTNDTTLVIKVRGQDNVLRSVTFTLA